MIKIKLIKKYETVIYIKYIEYILNKEYNDILELNLITNLQCSYNFEDSIELCDIIKYT